MNNNQLININQNSKQVLIKSKNLLDITKKILEKKELINNFLYRPFLMEKGHLGFIKSIAISPDGKYIVSGSGDKTIKIWDFKTGMCLNTLEGNEDSIDTVAISPDGKYIVSGSEDKTIKIWDIKTGECLNTLEGHENFISSVAISPNGEYIVSGSWDNTVKIWDIKTGECLNTLKGHSGSVYSIAISPDGKYIVSGDGTFRLIPQKDFGIIKIWDFKSGVCLNTLEGSTRYVNSIAISPDGKYIVSGGSDNTIKIWNIKTGESLKTLAGHSNSLYSIVITPDGKYIVSRSKYNTIKIWDFKTGKCLNTLEGLNLITIISSDGKYIVSGSWDNTVKIWDIKTGMCLNILEGLSSSISSVSISSNGKYIVCTDVNKNFNSPSKTEKIIKIFDFETGKCLKTLERLSSSVSLVSISSNRKYIVCTEVIKNLDSSSGTEEIIKIFDFETEKCLKILKGHEDSINSVAISPDGKYIVSGSDDETIKIWDIKIEKRLNTLKGHNDYVESVVISTDGNYIVSGSWDNTVKIWDFKTGECLNTLKGHSDSVYSVAISPDGKYIVSGSSDGTIKIWNFKTGENIYTIDNNYDISIDNNGYFRGNDENIDKYLRVSETPLTQRKLTLEEINYFIKKGDFLEIAKIDFDDIDEDEIPF